MAARRSKLVALAVSAGLHAALVGALLNASWTRFERVPGAPVEVVWIDGWPPTDPADVPETGPPDRDEALETSDAVDRTAVPPVAEPAAEAEPSDDEASDTAPDEARAERSADAPIEDDAAEDEAAEASAGPRAEEPDAPDTTERPRRAYTVRDVDIDDAWQAALEQTREQQRQQEGYRSFSLDDVLPAPEPVEPGPAESVFETAKKANRPPSVLSPGKASSRLGQRLARLCNELTGGFSLMGLASICADQEALPKLFAHLKPEYLRARPVCTEVDAPSPIDGEANAVKCRLVLDEEPTLD